MTKVTTTTTTTSIVIVTIVFTILGCATIGHGVQSRQSCVAGKCPRFIKGQVKFDVTFVSNAPTTIYMDGRVVAQQDSNKAVINEFTYVGKCSDFLIHLNNDVNDGAVAFSMAIKKFRRKGKFYLTYGTRQYLRGFNQTGDPNPIFLEVRDPTLISVVPLFAKSTNFSEPPSPEDFKQENFDFETWPPSRIVDSVLDVPILQFAFLEKQGILPLSFQDGPLNKGDFALRIYNTPCYGNVDPLDVIEN